MKITSNLKYQLLNVKRYKLYFIYITIIYLIYPVFGVTGELYLVNVVYYIDRFNSHQMITIYSNILITFLLLNEEVFKLFESYLYLYVKNIKNYLYSVFILLCLTHIISFVIGGAISYTINYLYFGVLPIKLIIVHTLIFSMEIISSVFLSMSLIIIFKNRVLALAIYIIVLTILMISSNIYLSLPLPMSLTQDYYETFAPSLWVGRIILMVISAVLFCFASKRFIDGVHGK